MEEKKGESRLVYSTKKMEKLYSITIDTQYGKKSISVFCGDILLFDQQIDILTTSAFYRSYHSTPGTVFKALNEVNISVKSLAINPEFDLRSLCNIWLSRQIDNVDGNIRRIGCIEMMYKQYIAPGFLKKQVDSHAMLQSVKAYFQMLDIAATYGINMETIVLPVLGGGAQNISEDLILIPLINECYEFLKRNSLAKQIIFIEKSFDKANRVAQMLRNSYSINSEQQIKRENIQEQKKQSPLAFISYSSKDKNVADNLCSKLEANGIKVWYAPRNIVGAYANAIAKAIRKSTHFIVILSKNSMTSEHVLNEIDLAFKKLPNNIIFMPLRIDDKEFAPAFDYYLSRQHWMDAYVPPLEERLNEFIKKIGEDIC